MPGRRSTSPGSVLPTVTASSGRKQRSPRAGPGKCWSGSAGRVLVLPDDAHHDALYDDVALVHAQRAHGGVRGLEPDPAARLAIKLLDRGVGAVHQRHDGLADVGLVALVHHDVVAVLDVLVDHGLPADLEHVASAAPRDQLVGNGQRVVAAQRFDRLAGRDEAQQRQLGRSRLTLRRHDFDGAALVVRAPDVPLALQVGEVLVDRGQVLKAELPGDLLEARGVALRVEVAGDEVQDLALTAGERHSLSPEYIPKPIYPKIDRTQGLRRPLSRPSWL